MKLTKNDKSLIFAFVFLSVFAGIFLYENAKVNEVISKQEKYEREVYEKLNTLVESETFFAKSVSIYDGTLEKKLYGKDDELKMPIASLAKIMTIIVALNKAEQNVVITEKDIEESGDNGLLNNELWSSVDLAKFSLILSSNDGASALAQYDEDFVLKMNEKAKRIGMENTTFLNVTGLDIDKKTAGAYASAFDVNTLALFALKAYPEIFHYTTLPKASFISLSGLTHDIQNTNIIIDKIPSPKLSKTGFTYLAGGNLVVVFKNKDEHEIAVTLLGSTIDGRFSDMEKIIEVLYNS